MSLQKKSRKPRRSNHWRKYAAATAGLAAGAGASSAQAAITYYDPPDATIGGGSEIYFDLNSLNVSATPFAGWDVTLYFYGGGESPVVSNLNSDSGAYTLSSTTVPNSALFAAKLGDGQLIGPSDPFGFYGYFQAVDLFGEWLGGGTGYIGLQLPAGGSDFNYGWARITYDDDGNTLTLHDYALESTINTPILAGAGAQEIPEPNGLLLAAMGAAGLYALRRRQKKQADAA